MFSIFSLYYIWFISILSFYAIGSTSSFAFQDVFFLYFILINLNKTRHLSSCDQGLWKLQFVVFERLTSAYLITEKKSWVSQEWQRKSRLLTMWTVRIHLSDHTPYTNVMTLQNIELTDTDVKQHVCREHRGWTVVASTQFQWWVPKLEDRSLADSRT